LFSQNRPDVLVPVKVEGDPVDLTLLPPESVATNRAVPLKPFEPEFIPTLYATGGLNRERNEVVLFLSNPFPEIREAQIQLRGQQSGPSAAGWQLTDESPDAINTLDAPEIVSPKRFALALKGSEVVASLPAYSLTVLRVPVQSAQR
jgi:alpha-L-arabinofuranosidase